MVCSYSFCISGDIVRISWAVLRFAVPQEVSLPKCSMHYLCSYIVTCPSIRNLRPCTLSATSCAPFKVRTAVLMKIEVFRDVDATGHPRIFDTDTHHPFSFGIWLRTRTYGDGPLWVQLCLIVVDKILVAIFFFIRWADFGFSRRNLAHWTVLFSIHLPLVWSEWPHSRVHCYQTFTVVL